MQARTTFLLRHQRPLVFLVGALGILRVLFYSAAFPFFNNVDEQAHFDLVVKYSNGYLPQKGDNLFSRESATHIVRYGSPEFLKSPADYESKRMPPPLWTLKNDKLDAMLNTVEEKLTRIKNHEAFSPPTYYLIAGLWYALGKSWGISGIHLLYWTRLLNGVFFGLLLWVSVKFCKRMYGERPELILGMLMLLAVFPQDAFYAINADALSPLFFMLSFHLLFGLYTSQKHVFYHFLAGLLVAGTFLIKLSNLPVVFMFMVFFILAAKRLYESGRLKRNGLNLTVLFLSFALPIAAWMVWNRIYVGDITATAEKIQHLGWKPKSFSSLWDHPIFSLQGAYYFLSENIRSLWRGEFVWGFTRIASSKMDCFYVFSTIVFSGTALLQTAFFHKNEDSLRRQMEWLNLFLIGCALLTLAVLSLQWDYGDSWYPSRKNPYFTSGRLILFMLVPFVVFYIKGQFWIWCKISKQTSPLIVLMGIAGAITVSELVLSLEVFGSPYNWFHSF